MSSERASSIPGYTVLERLGRGRRGEVVLAESDDDGARVWVERARARTRREAARFRQELALVSRLEHPGLARLVAFGGADRDLWWASAVEEGASLRRVLQGGAEQSEHPEPWWTHAWGISQGLSLEPLRMAREVADGLAYLHGEGRIHGALRPESILLRVSGSSVLVDLGPSGVRGLRGQATPPGIRSADLNAVAYLAPEQIQGEPFDARGDLYALGCVLYEMLTGRPPFEGGPHEVIQQHLRDRPTRPSRFTEDIPRALERLVLQLLRKPPEARPGYASVVARALAAIDERAPDQSGERLPGRPYLYRPTLAGRGLMLSKLKAAVSETADRRGSFLLMSGGHGSGRSRLLAELAQWADRSLCEVFTGACRPPESARARLALGPFAALFESLYERCRVAGPEVTKRLLGNEGRVLAQLDASFDDLPGLADLPVLTRLSPLASQQRVFVSMLRIIERLASQRPVLLIIEDIEWADPWTRDLLRFLARVRREVPRRWTLVATYCDEMADEAALVEGLAGEPGVTTLRMEPLDPATLGDMIGSMLAWPAPPSDFTHWLFERSSGRPLYAAEFLRAALVEGRLSLDPDGGWQLEDGKRLSRASAAALELPNTLDGLIERRLARLDPAAVELLELAALMGLYVEIGWLEEAASPEAWATLDELARERLLVLSGEGDLRLAHMAVRRVLLHRLADPDAVERLGAHHRAIARALSQAEAKAPELAVEVARHWQAVGEWELVRQAYHRAAAWAEARGDYIETQHVLGCFLGQVDEATPATVQARIRLADLFASTGQAREALEHSREAHREAESLEDATEAMRLEADALLVIARAMDTLGVGEETLASLERAGELLAEIGDHAGRARSLVQVAQVHRRLGNRDDALRAALEALTIFRETGERDEEGATLIIVGLVLKRMGHHERAADVFEDALAINREVNNRASEAAALANLGLLARDGADLDLAGQRIGEALSIYASIGDLVNLGAMHRYLGLLAYMGSRYDDAIHHLERAVSLARDAGAEPDEAMALSLLTVARIDKGMLEEALESCEAALALHRLVGNRASEAHGISYLAQIRLAQRDFESATRLFEHALAIDREIGARALRGTNLVGLAHCLYQLPNVDEEALARAGDLFQKGRAAQQATQSPAQEAHALIKWALFNRRMGRVARAKGQLERAEELLASEHQAVARILLLCERGHIELAESRRADAFLSEASRMAKELGLLPTSEVGRALDRLARAEIARGASQPLSYGEDA